MSFATGQRVSLTLMNDEVVKGEIYNYEPNNNIIILYTSVNGHVSHLKKSFRMINTDYVKSVKAFGKNKDSTVPFATQNSVIPSVDTEQILKQESETNDSIKNSLGNVNAAGQAIFDELSGTYQCEWEKDAIRIEKNTLIYPPYHPENIKGENVSRFSDVLRKTCQRLNIE